MEIKNAAAQRVKGQATECIQHTPYLGTPYTILRKTEMHVQSA